ncbi:MAG: hypothetical protein A2005_10765 [Desulfuromonadales bacterium GWC2_61_20]|nr:MAG: hypothetical protein A2005_10765 [Desulfuromonadales bacterium GWC2_61_20]HBT83756.1 toxin HigB-2 [Desulfuromonas sp.]
MQFVESRLFSKKLPAYLADDEYRALQAFLLEMPDAGDVIKGGGGVRKLRWSVEGRGKRGGIRVIYYLELAESRFLLLTLYAKNELEDLTPHEIKLLKKIVEEWNHG